MVCNKLILGRTYSLGVHVKKILLSFAATALSYAGANALAAVEIDVTEVAGDVVFDISGSLIVSDANYVTTAGYSVGIITGGNNWYIATGDEGSTDRYVFSSADGAFGTNTVFNTSFSSSTGSRFFIWGQSGGVPQVGVRAGYTDGEEISAQLVYQGETLASLALTEGVYTYNLPSDTITLTIGAAPVPVPAAAPLMLAGLAAFGWKKRRSER